jgi:hypothetical protein
VIVIEVQGKRKTITSHRKDANQNNPLPQQLPPFWQREGTGTHPGWNYSPILLISAKAGEKGSGKIKKFSS